MGDDSDLTVYYDGSCPICRAEIDEIARADSQHRIVAVDCSAALFADRWAERDGVDRAAMMRELHVRDRRGRWYRGPAAFERIYAGIGLTPLARFWGSKRFARPIRAAYGWFARNRGWLARLPVTPLVRAPVRWLAARRRSARRRHADTR